MKIEHIIWDYNGTLLDDVSTCVEIINEMLEKRNLKKISINEYKKLFDFPVKDYYERTGFDFKKESFEKVGTEFIKKYNERSKNLKLHAGIKKLLKKISDAGIKMSILSARKKEQLDNELKMLEIYNYFDYVFGLNDHYAGGKTEKGKELLKKINIDKNKILMAGDTVHDCETAKILEIDCIAVSYGHHPKEKLEKICKNKIAENTKDIEKFIFPDNK